MTTSHKTKWREARMRLKNRDVMTIFNRDGTTTEVEHPFSALQALHYEQQIDIDKIKKALLIAYIGDVGCTLSNEDCNDLTKYISRLEGNIAAYENDLPLLSASKRIAELEAYADKLATGLPEGMLPKDRENRMNERLSNEKLEEIAKYNKQVTMDCNVKVLNAMATEILELRADASTSQNHNAGVIDRIVEQLREAGYTGTLSDMVDEVIAKASDDYNGL